MRVNSRLAGAEAVYLLSRASGWHIQKRCCWKGRQRVVSGLLSKLSSKQPPEFPGVFAQGGMIALPGRHLISLNESGLCNIMTLVIRGKHTHTPL